MGAVAWLSPYFVFYHTPGASGNFLKSLKQVKILLPFTFPKGTPLSTFPPLLSPPQLSLLSMDKEAQEPILPTAQGLGSAGDDNNGSKDGKRRGGGKGSPSLCLLPAGVGGTILPSCFYHCPSPAGPSPTQPSWLSSFPTSSSRESNSGSQGSWVEEEKRSRCVLSRKEGFPPALGT